jgi:hypothetical protein
MTGALAFAGVSNNPTSPKSRKARPEMRMTDRASLLGAIRPSFSAFSNAWF